MKKPKDFNIILNRIHAAQNWRDSCYKDRWRENIKQYRSIADKKPQEFSNIFVPQTFMMCETVKARVAESLFANRPYVSVLPRNTDDASNAKAAESLIDWQLNERMNIKRLFADDILQDAIVLGTAVCFTGWLKQERQIKEKMEITIPLVDDDGNPFIDDMGMPAMVTSEELVPRMVTVYDDPLTQKVDLFDFYVDRTATTIQDARFCGHVEYLTKEQIENFVENAGWKVDWENVSPIEDITGGKEIRAEITGATLGGADDTYDNKDKNSKYAVTHYWEDNRHVVIINDVECVLDEENPFNHGEKPYDKCCYVPLTNEFYGIGIPETVKDLQAELNTARNMRIDYNAMALRRMWKIRKGCGLTPKDLVWKQGGVLQVDDMEDILEINVQPLPASAFSNEDVIKQDMRDATGVHDIILGLAQADETATTTMTKDNNASIRFKFFIEAVVDDMLLPIVNKMLSMDTQYLEQGRIIRLIDDAGQAGELLAILPDELGNDYDFYYVGSSVEPMANKELNKNKMIEAYQLAMANPVVQQDMNIQRNLLRELFNALEIKEVDKIVPSENELPMMSLMASQMMSSGGPQQATSMQAEPMISVNPTTMEV